MLVGERIVAAITRGTGFFQHGHTYIGHPVACAAALAVQKVIQRDGLLGAVQRQGAGLRERLTQQFAAHPKIGDIRGRGLLMAIELVEDRASKRAFDAPVRLHARIKKPWRAAYWCIQWAARSMDVRETVSCWRRRSSSMMVSSTSSWSGWRQRSMRHPIGRPDTAQRRIAP